MKSDLEIAQEVTLQPIALVAKNYGISEENLELYGKYKAKLSQSFCSAQEGKQKGKLILVTATNPTPLGEGKTTVSIGLNDALNRLGKKSIVALREPSLGPCFGVKGGAAGGGYAQVAPMEDINLHFTGDFHAITSANNLLAAVLDNHIHQGNALEINPKKILWKRCLDMNDRVLRNVIVGLGNQADGAMREDHFQITVASEIMAILCLAKDMKDLQERLDKIVVAYNKKGERVYAKDLECTGAMAVLLKDAMQPNLVQSLEGNLAIIHGGPFANIAHGCNSIRATKMGLALADFLVTEAGFGADLGAEKFFDIKCAAAGLTPSCAVIVTTLRTLKYYGGLPREEISKENREALEKGLENLEKHIENVKKFGVPAVVAVNRFATDTEGELSFLKDFCAQRGVRCAIMEAYGKGSEGGEELAKAVLETVEAGEVNFHTLQTPEQKISQKIELLAKEIYGADGVEYSNKAREELKKLEESCYSNLPICMAKTPYSLSDKPNLLGRPKNFRIEIRELSLSAGAGFVVCLAGDVMTMPGLPKEPAAKKIGFENEKIVGIF
ncbi:formate--tetrahydrofolate ligase [Oribacterium sinus]|uniref:Formate--tetrahydrofolate ligase n=1 Tax=Oribacterium sinus F0268 TaxID=585501 RepID=C2KVD3_9FIRM|nr:formate--tetrahydrofolate ligase [Oribacterium sinus]EEJ52261.1 formate--tetrahydrofolate ligase [Oribacterium sinus F0268]